MNDKKREKKKLLESQRQLIILKNQLIMDAQNEYQRTLNVIAGELGIDIEKETWQLDDKIEYFAFLKKRNADLVIPSRKHNRRK